MISFHVNKWLIPAHHFDHQMIYFTFGTKDVLERECKDLDQCLELFMDGQPVPLPSLESLVVLNIPCWGAGVKPWTLGTGKFGRRKKCVFICGDLSSVYPYF